MRLCMTSWAARGIEASFVIESGSSGANAGMVGFAPFVVTFG
jgi:hypothetical protein